MNSCVWAREFVCLKGMRIESNVFVYVYLRKKMEMKPHQAVCKIFRPEILAYKRSNAHVSVQKRKQKRQQYWWGRGQ